MSANLNSIFPQFNLSVENGLKNTIYLFDGYRLDADRLMLYRDEDEISLPPKAVETLIALVENPGVLISKDDLMQRVWGGSVVEESNLSHYLYLLRKSLGSTPDGRPYIETYRRRGYVFNAEVSTARVSDGIDSVAQGGETSAAVLVPHRAQPGPGRRGNVVALTDWRASDRGYTENISSAVESAKASPLERFLPGKGAVALAIAALLLVAALSLVAFRAASNDTVTAARGETTFIHLTDGNEVTDAAISPDGKFFAYHEIEGSTARLWLQQTGQAGRLEMVPPFEGGASGKTFSPDSQFLYFVAWDKGDEVNTLYRIATLGGAKTKILTGINSPVSFSPDGREMVFTRQDPKSSEYSLMIAASDGLSERVLLRRPRSQPISYASAAWSPDGTLIAFGSLDQANAAGNGCSIMGADPRTGEVRPLSPEKWDSCYRAAWTHDGHGLVFVGTRGRESLSTRRDQIFYLSVPGGEARRLTTDGSRYQIASLGVTDEGDILAVPFHRESQIWSMDASGAARTAVQITNGESDGKAGIAILPDGRVGYLTRAGDGFSIWIMNSAGTDRRQLTTDPSNIQGLAASPDGRYFIFSAQVEGAGFHLYRIDTDGANLKQLTFNDGVQVDPAISPDGTRVVYTTGVFDGSSWKISVWSSSVDGDAPVQLTREECAMPQVSPDSKMVSCVNGQKINILSTNGNVAVKSLDTPEKADLGMGAKWTPDGRGLLYTAQRNGVLNIWISPVTGERARPFTDFQNGDIYDFAFSRDNSRLYLARGRQICYALLIRNFDAHSARH